MGLGGGEERQQRPERSPRTRTNWRPSTPSRNQKQRRPNPYQSTASQNSGFPFASRFGQQQAPLFYSAADEFREENDEEEHEREIADYYALQKSRRQIGGSELKGSSEADADESLEETASSTEDTSSRVIRPRGIRSSWKGGASASIIRPKQPMSTTVEDDIEDERSESTSIGKGRMVEIGLGDTLRSEADDDPPDDFIEDPPSIQQLRKPIRSHEEDDHDTPFMGMGDDDDDDRALLGQSHAPSSLPDDLVPQIVQPISDPPRHDVFWGHIYLLSLAAMFATWFLVYLHTEPPGIQKPIGDTVYSTLHASFHLLAIYTIVSIFVSLFWLAALRSYVRYLVYGILVAVPVILYAFSLYPFISSFTGTWHGDSLQDVVMRYASLAPALIATLWILAVIRGRLVMQKAISILEFATRILGANPALLIAGFVVLGDSGGLHVGLAFHVHSSLSRWPSSYSINDWQVHYRRFDLVAGCIFHPRLSVEYCDNLWTATHDHIRYSLPVVFPPTRSTSADITDSCTDSTDSFADDLIWDHRISHRLKLVGPPTSFAPAQTSHDASWNCHVLAHPYTDRDTDQPSDSHIRGNTLTATGYQRPRTHADAFSGAHRCNDLFAS